MNIRPILRRMLSMSPEAWYIWIRTIQLCVFLLLCSFVLLLEWSGSLLDYKLYLTALALNETAQALLLIALLASVIMEELQS